jgi:hypothetical protein
MIYIEQKDGFTYTYSDTYKIRKIGTDEIYTDAMDALDYQYEETDMPLEVPEADAQDIIKILTGEMP